MLIDTHCHLDFLDFDFDRDEVVRRAKENNVDFIINIGSSIEGSRKSIELTQKYPNLYSTVGIHPHEADNFTLKEKELIRGMVKEDKVVAIGEIGLDYFKSFSKPSNQRRLFLSLLELALESNKPLVIHTRQAEPDTLRILKGLKPLRAVVHCFSGNRSFLDECLNMGFFVSFTCNITYKKASDLRELVKVTPLDRLMLETDAPFLPPEGFRGRRNEPMQVRLLAEFIGQIKGVSLEEISFKTTQNAKNFFGF
jgi:TatD DNase family protein